MIPKLTSKEFSNLVSFLQGITLNTTKRGTTAISKLPCASISEEVFVKNLSYVNEFDLDESEYVAGTHYLT